MVLSRHEIRIPEGVKRDGIMIYGSFLHPTTPKVMIQAVGDNIAGSRGHPGGCKNEAKSLRIYDAD